MVDWFALLVLVGLGLAIALWPVGRRAGHAPQTVRVVLRVQDQADSLEGLVRAAAAAATFACPGWEPRLTIVDIGSRDDTLRILERLAAAYPFLEWHSLPRVEAGAFSRSDEKTYFLDASRGDARRLAEAVCRLLAGDGITDISLLAPAEDGRRRPGN